MNKVTTVIILLTSINCQSQTLQDKSKIYQIVIEKFSDKTLPIINETFSRIYKYDIDGNFDKWFYQKSNQPSSDTSEITVSAICTTPIQYSQPIIEFLRTTNLPSNPSNLQKQVDEISLDSLSNYLSNERLISWKKAPLSNSFLGNLFRKRKVVVLSGILFDQQYNIAIVKLQVLSKSKTHSKNPSSIIVLKKTGGDWLTIGLLDEKQQPTVALALGGGQFAGGRRCVACRPTPMLFR